MNTKQQVSVLLSRICSLSQRKNKRQIVSSCYSSSSSHLLNNYPSIITTTNSIFKSYHTRAVYQKDYLTSTSVSLGVDENGLPLSQSFQKPTISYDDYLLKFRAIELGEIEANQETVKEMFLYIKYDRISGLSHRSREEIEGLYKYALLNCYRFESSFDRSLCAQNLFDKLMEVLFQRELKEFDMSLLEGKVHLKPEDVIPVVLNDTNIYSILIDIYTENNFPEQIFELFGSMKRNFYILHKQEEILQGVSTIESSPVEEQLTISVSDHHEENDKIYVSEEHLQQVINIEMEHIYEPEEPKKEASNSYVSILDAPEDPNDTDVIVENFPRLSAKSFNQLIDACAYIGKIKDIYQLLLFMIHKNIELSTETLNKTIKSCIPSGSSYEALKLFDMIRQHSESVIPNIETCKLLLEACFEAADEHSYKDIYDGMKQLVVCEENNITEIDYENELFFTYLKCKCTSSIPSSCKEALQNIFEYESKIGKKVDISYYNLVMEACARIGEKETSLQIMNLTLKEYGAMKELQEAGTSQVNPQQYLLPTLDTFNNLLKAFSFDGDRRTVDLYKHIKKMCRELFKPNIQTYNAIIATEIKLGDVVRAKKILREIRSRGLIPNITSFNQLFIGYYKTDWEQHMKEFREKERTSVFKTYFEKWEKEQNALKKSQEETTKFDDAVGQAVDEILFDKTSEDPLKPNTTKEE
ncbi:predicted protein [Naegleria gruberi]|uniref:Predicted protein n=1 Tax=Naegleria gruberi TaxID=5762 RepID=D2UZN1_NAEGR|nr:uncharacterized protein NAEGRDRAFT_45514 [Naegleria gruberi]EFC49967.1 predicted protein [Naegleria gruberi]|eukprot:XP_002682711.1 predicted protein [Naegleria gruberi strain NEG-M]